MKGKKAQNKKSNVVHIFFPFQQHSAKMVHLKKSEKAFGSQCHFHRICT
jgi:hypothetical protein